MGGRGEGILFDKLAKHPNLKKNGVGEGGVVAEVNFFDKESKSDFFFLLGGVVGGGMKFFGQIDKNSKFGGGGWGGGGL